jgi:hypothetical protein
MPRRVNPGGSSLRLAAAAVRQALPDRQSGRQLLGELAGIAVGTSQAAPSRNDRRFADPGERSIDHALVGIRKLSRHA